MTKKTKRVFKTLDELASQYEIHIYRPGNFLHIVTDNGDTFACHSYDIPDTPINTDARWLEIFTKEVEE